MVQEAVWEERALSDVEEEEVWEEKLVEKLLEDMVESGVNHEVMLNNVIS